MATPHRSRVTAFDRTDWALLLGVGAMWGASFLLIKLAATDLPPVTVAWLRLVFGVCVLACFPSARKPLTNVQDRYLVAVLGLIWMAMPFVLFPWAEQRVGSAVAGMMNGAAPLFTALIATAWHRSRPSPSVTAGLIVGFSGVLAMTLPLASGQASAPGVAMLLAATIMYGFAFNLAAPLQTRNGALPVVLRAQIVALVITTPTGLLGMWHDHSASLTGWISIVLLGTVCTGLAFATFVSLVGRVGATRASVSVYLAPAVAVMLGAIVASEPIQPLALVGVVLTLIGAYLTSRTNAPAPTALSKA